LRSEDRGILDEGGVGVAEIGLENRELESAFAQGIAVACMLMENLIEVRSAEIDGGQTVCKVAARNANDGTGEQNVNAPIEGIGGLGASVYRLRLQSESENKQ
jgi:hypothetical protein